MALPPHLVAPFVSQISFALPSYVLPSTSALSFRKVRPSLSLASSCTSKLATTSPPRRHLWWGRHIYRNRSSTSDTRGHGDSMGYRRILKYKACRSPTASSSCFKLFRPAQSWRPASSWGGGNGWRQERDSDSPGEKKYRGKDEDREEELGSGKGDLQKRLERWNWLSEIRKEIERDAYGALFAGSDRRGVWNPWNVGEVWRRKLEEVYGIAGREEEPRPSANEGRKEMKTPREENTLKTGQAVESTSIPRMQAGEEYDIDLISLRKIQRKPSIATEPDRKPYRDDGVNIPVKPFESNKMQPGPVDSPERSPKSWLAREGFSQADKVSENSKSSPSQERDKDTRSPMVRHPVLETSLDRHLYTSGELPSMSDASVLPCSEKATLIQDVAKIDAEPSRQPLEYKAEENKVEDIDLLRASDVRASTRHVLKSLRISRGSALEQRKKLEDDFVKRPRDLESKFAEELLANGAPQGVTQGQAVSSDVDRPITDLEPQHWNKVSNQEPPTTNVDAWGYNLTPKGLEISYQDELDNKMQSIEHYYTQQQQEILAAEEQKQDQQREAADAALAKEIQAQKTAMEMYEARSASRLASSASPPTQGGEGDMSANVHEFVGRERWYKQNAPHALEQERQIKMQAEEQRAKDQALHREIRDIYEEAYGIIDTKHRQPAPKSLSDGEEADITQKGFQDMQPLDFKKLLKDKVEREESMDLTDAVRSTEKMRDLPVDKVKSIPQGDIVVPVSSVVKRNEVDQEREIPIDEGKKSMMGKIASTDLDAEEVKLLYSAKPTSAKTIDVSTSTATPLQHESDIQSLSKAHQQQQISQPASSAANGSERAVPSPQTQSLQAELIRYRDFSRETVRMLGLANISKSNTLKLIRRYEKAIARVISATQAYLHERKSRELGTSGPMWEKRRDPIQHNSPETSQFRLGTTTTTDRQETMKIQQTAPTESLASQAASVTQTYKILSLDPATQNVIAATTTTSLYEKSSPPRSIPAILSHLRHPAKFFDHFPPLEAAGYELVAGSRETLVFKKVGEEVPVITTAMQETINNFLEGNASKNGPRSTGNPVEAATEEEVVIDNDARSAMKAEYSNDSLQRDLIAAMQTEVPRLLESHPANQKAMKELITKIVQQALQSARARKLSTLTKPESETLQRPHTSSLDPPAEPTTITEPTSAEFTPAEPTHATTASSIPHSNSTASVPAPPVRRSEPHFSGARLANRAREVRRKEIFARQAAVRAFQAGKELRDMEAKRARRRARAKSVGKLVLGGVWVALCIYCVGIILEAGRQSREKRRKEQREMVANLREE